MRTAPFSIVVLSILTFVQVVAGQLPPLQSSTDVNDAPVPPIVRPVSPSGAGLSEFKPLSGDSGQPVTFLPDAARHLGTEKGSQPMARMPKKTVAKAPSNAAAKAHKGLFFENDFSYLRTQSGCGEWFLGDSLKNLRSGNLSIGGQYRMRAHYEQNMRGLGLTGNDDRFLLHRTRIYTDWRIAPRVRVYAEMIDAESNYENFAPRPIEVNRTDMLNLFVDATIGSVNGNELVARVGRQELLFGDQRLVSPLDWANTRRNFDGVRLSTKNKESGASFDAFWTQPVTVDDRSFDAPDRDQEFMGLYSSWKTSAGNTADAYLLRYLNGRAANNFKYNTAGLRANGKWRDGWLYDFEGAVQFGSNTDGSDHSAGMTTLGIGRQLAFLGESPKLWMYYDWASGDGDQGAGNGFHHNFPLAHKYLGFMDLYGRRNIQDVNLLFTSQVAPRVKFLAWYHYFFLATKSDTPYSVVMTPFLPGSTPGDADLGQEIDMILSCAITPRQQLLLGYSHFFSGDYYNTTAGVPWAGDAEFFYTQWTVNF